MAKDNWIFEPRNLKSEIIKPLELPKFEPVIKPDFAKPLELPKFEPINIKPNLFENLALPKLEPVDLNPKYEPYTTDRFPRNSAGGLIPPPGVGLSPLDNPPPAPLSYNFMNKPPSW